VMVTFAFLAACIFSSCFAAPLSSNNLPVCIVGGGIAGASTAYFLHESDVADVLLVERGGRLGGRLLSTLVDSVRVDVGGDAWMDANENMMHLMKTLPIQLNKENYSGNGKTAIFDGRRLFPASKFEPVTAAEIVATLELLKLRLRENYETFASSSFDSIQDYANAHLNPYLRESSRAFAERWLAHSEFFTRFEWEPMTRTIYDQNLNVTLFAGLVALLSTQRSYTCANGLFVIFFVLELRRKKKTHNRK
jgi:protoporphyrinogen oxidase